MPRARSLVVALSLSLGAALAAQAAPATAEAPVTVTVEEWCSFYHEPDNPDPQADIVMPPVGDGDWGTQNKKRGSCFVYATANFKSRLKCPLEVDLTRLAPPPSATLPASAQITLIGVNEGYWEDGTWQYYDMDRPGSQYCFTLVAEIDPSKHGFTWGAETLAGTYWGEIVMELYPQP